MIRTVLMKHQESVVNYCSPLPYAGVFASYGSGKSLCALKIIDNNGWQIVLIVSTVKSVESTWPDEIVQHSNFFYVTLAGSSQEKFRTIKKAFAHFAAYGKKKFTVIFLTNFDGVKGIFQIITAIKPQACFLDEGTKIRNSETMRSKVMWALGRSVPRRYLMTGFPITGDGFGTEIYSQIKYLDRGATFGNSYEAFLDEYFTKKQGRWKLKPRAAKKIFDKIKDFCIMIPEDVIKLPPKVYKEIRLNPSQDQIRMFAQLKEKMKGAPVYAQYMKSLEICDGFIFDEAGKPQFFDTPKDESLLELLEEIGTGEKVLIWTTFIPTIMKLQKILTRFGYGVLTLHGKTENSGRVVKAFQNSSRYNALISTIFSGDASITLTACRHAVYYSHWWSNDKRGNSEARIRRKGSERHGKKSIFYTDMFLKGTIEEDVRGNIKSKAELVTQLKKYFS